LIAASLTADPDRRNQRRAAVRRFVIVERDAIIARSNGVATGAGVTGIPPASGAGRRCRGRSEGLMDAAPGTPVATRSRLMRLAILWLAGADLRLTVLAVPPLLPLIHRDLGLSEGAVGALSGLPVLLLGLAAIPGSLVIARIGARRTAVACLLFVAVTAAARGAGPSVATLFGMTLLMGAGIAVLQPALPTLVAEWFPDLTGFATAVYANGLLIGEAIPAAVTIPFVLPRVGGGWPAALAVWSLPAAATALLMFGPVLRRQAAAAAAGSARWWPDWQSPMTWQLGLLTGGTGGLYFSTNAFVADYLHAIGRPELVSAALAALNAGQLPASFVLLYTLRRVGVQRSALAALMTLALPALLGLVLLRSTSAIALCSGAIGFFCAFVLISTLALPPQLAAPGDVHRLSAGMFAIGYTLSCAIPPLGGILWDLTHVPASAFIASAASAAVVAATALTLPKRLAPRPGD
jgi:MFS transporter, CP family, cyanate transporter